MNQNQVRMWRHERGWQITINANMSRIINSNGLTRADIVNMNGKNFITFSSPTQKAKRNVSVTAKGKTACNAYIRLQATLAPLAERLNLTGGEHFLNLSENTSRTGDRLTFQIVSVSEKAETAPEPEQEHIETEPTSNTQREAIDLLGRMYYAQPRTWQEQYSDTYHRLLEYIISRR